MWKKIGVLEMAAFSWKGTPQESKEIRLREEEMGKQQQRGKAAKTLSWGREGEPQKQQREHKPSLIKGTNRNNVQQIAGSFGNEQHGMHSS